MEVWVYVIFGEYIPPLKKNNKKTKNVTHFIRIKFLVSFKEGYIIFLVKTHAKILSRKTNVPSVWKRPYTFLTYFRAKKLKLFAKKNKTKPSKLLKFKVGHRKLFRKSFWSVTWESNDLRVQKWHFSRFWKILSDKVEAGLCKAKRSKLL